MISTLPGRVIVLTDRVQARAAGHDLAAVVAQAAGGGADAVILREKDLAGPDRLRLGREVAAALVDTTTGLIVASDPGLARQVGACGVHLARGDAWPRPGDVEGLAVGRSCHDRDELLDAVAAGATYVTLSPIFPTRSKPGYGPPIGPGGAADLAGGLTRSTGVVALGGITARNARACVRAGLHAVGVMGAVMTAPDPRRAVADLVAAVAPAPSGVVAP